jgi:hypothetical protein
MIENRRDEKHSSVERHNWSQHKPSVRELTKILESVNQMCDLAPVGIWIILIK